MGVSRRVAADALAWFLAANAAACAGAALLAHGGRFSQRYDVLAHFSWLYLAGGVALAIPALFLRNWGRPTVLGLGALAIAASLALMISAWMEDPGPQAPADAPGQIKIIQYNALRTNTDLKRQVDWLIAQDPDIVTISEARQDLLEMIRKRTRWDVAGRKSNLMIFSRRKRLVMNRPRLGGDTPLTFVNATFEGPGGQPYEVVTAHLDWPTHRIHARQAVALGGVVSLLPRERMILTGDFNAAPWSFGLKRMARRLGLTRRDGALATFPADRRGFPWPIPVLPIDHVYAGPGWATVSVTRGPRLGSDHYPLIVVLAPVAPDRADP